MGTLKNLTIDGPKRPMPPRDMFDPMSAQYRPAQDVTAWVRQVLISLDGALHNPDHKHLEYADVEFLWAGNGFVKQGRMVLGQCEEVTFRCGAWQKGRQEQQMAEWFGRVPGFLITLDATYCKECSDLEFCALVEHELMHIGQKLDMFGAPAFDKNGSPKLEMRGHDIEEFIGVVRRYGHQRTLPR